MYLKTDLSYVCSLCIITCKSRFNYVLSSMVIFFTQILLPSVTSIQSHTNPDVLVAVSNLI